MADAMPTRRWLSKGHRVAVTVLLVLSTVTAWILVRDELASITGLHDLAEVGPLEFFAAIWLFFLGLMLSVAVIKKGTGQ